MQAEPERTVRETEEPCGARLMRASTVSLPAAAARSLAWGPAVAAEEGAPATFWAPPIVPVLLVPAGAVRPGERGGAEPDFEAAVRLELALAVGTGLGPGAGWVVRSEAVALDDEGVAIVDRWEEESGAAVVLALCKK